MRCEDCKNTQYCATFRAESQMFGCTSGVPDYLPAKVAEGIVRNIKSGAGALGISESKYFEEVLREIRAQFAQIEERK